MGKAYAVVLVSVYSLAASALYVPGPKWGSHWLPGPSSPTLSVALVMPGCLVPTPLTIFVPTIILCAVSVL
eukprot:CAMPEP_0119474490 /NCGR_PEP_ID=MMETSP1344-20130328/5723_1 /TAXON_ID=236787 /ORGANISM="Florenciella parvula, Strain CCMP2471" /LENGTH=70 /DNA_ID=CAMNT_0007507799 /DNA_START=792 /DNA_END=1004 /DNA_ORIENTATION=+